MHLTPQLHRNMTTVLRHAGYAPFVDPLTKEASYILRLTSEFYPRFHLYVTRTDNEHVLDLHLDQTQPSYGAWKAHRGEDSGPTVEKEMQRIVAWFRAQ